jgi:hypothetical protein
MEATPGEVKEGWKRDGLARHALALAATRKVTRGKRFWVEGHIDQMLRMVTISNEWTGRCCEWLTRLLMNPKPYLNRTDGLVRFGAGKLLVNEQALVDAWKLYFPDTRIEAETSKIGSALRALSSNDRPTLRFNGVRRRYRDINLDNLFAWSEANGFGDRAAMLRTVWDGQTPPGESPESAPNNETDDLSTLPSANGGSQPL